MVYCIPKEEKKNCESQVLQEMFARDILLIWFLSTVFFQ